MADKRAMGVQMVIYKSLVTKPSHALDVTNQVTNSNFVFFFELVTRCEKKVF